MTITALSDGQLLEQARHGDEAAFTELYVRHQPAALRLARTYRRTGDPDDLVNGAFERVLGALRRGAGPTESFRAYLFVTLRRLAAQTGDRPADEPLDEVPEPVLDEAEAPELAQADRELIGQAFESLPDRWQAVLWHTAVEGRQPSELAGVLGVSGNAAAAMAYRAREKLRQAYLQAHLLASPAPEHEPYRSQLGAYVRDGLSARDRAAVEGHLRTCDACTALVAELEDVNRTLTRAVLPLFVLAGGGKLVAGAAAAGAATGAEGGASSDAGLLAKLRHAAPTVGSTAAIAAVVGGIVGMGAMLGREDTGPLDSTADAADIGVSGEDGEAFDGGDGGDRSGDGDTLFGDDDFVLSPFDDRLSDLGDFGDRFDIPRGRSSGITGSSGLGSGIGSSGIGSSVRGPVGSVRSTVPGRSRTSGTVSPPAAPPASPRPASPPSAPPRTSPPPTSPPPTSPPPTSPPPTTPPPTTPPPTTPPPTTPPPTTPPPTTPPPTTPPPAPAPLTFAGAVWVPTGVGTGTLSFTIGEAGGAPAGPQADPAASGTLVLRVTLTGQATFANDGLPSGCTLAAATTAECTFAQPASGATVSIESLPLVVGGPGATASAEILRDGVSEATLADPVPLTPFEAGITLAVSPEPWSSTGPGAGTLRVIVAQAAAWEVVGLTIMLLLTGGARLDLGRADPECVEEPRGGGYGVTCPVPAVPGGGSVEVQVPLTVEGEGQQAEGISLGAGAGVVATLDERIQLPAP